MTRDELNTHINDIKHWPTGMFGSIIIGWLEDIRDNGIAEPKKYTVNVLGDDESFLSKTPRGSFYFGALSTADACGDQNGFTQAEIDKFKKRGDIAIDWNKAIIEPVEEDNEDD